MTDNKQNWGVVPFVESIGSWYWGHGRLGSYSIVWYDALTPRGTECISAYVARDGRVLGSQCSGIQVRPTGANSSYPPTQVTGNPAGFYITIDLGSSGVLDVNVSSLRTIVDSTHYRRWTGQLKGGMQGLEVLEGVALYEQFALNA